MKLSTSAGYCTEHGSGAVQFDREADEVMIGLTAFNTGEERELRFSSASADALRGALNHVFNS